MKSFQEYVSLVFSELEEVFQRIDEKDLPAFLKCLQDADRIFMLGVGREGLSARAFVMRLMHLGKEAYWIWDDTTPGIKNGDLLICTSGSAEIGHEIYICRQAKNHGAQIALITAAEEGEIHELSDLAVVIPAEAFHAKGNMVPTRQLMGNLFEQSLFLFYDITSMMLKERLKVTDAEMEERHRNIE